MGAQHHMTWDRMGQGLSLLCLAHCLLTPLLLGALPSVGLHVLHSPGVHLGLAAVIVVVSAWAFLPGYRRHGQLRVLVLGGLGLLGLLVASLVLEPRSELLGTTGTAVASILLVWAHVLNRRAPRLA